MNEFTLRKIAALTAEGDRILLQIRWAERAKDFPTVIALVQRKSVNDRTRDRLRTRLLKGVA